MYEGVRRLGLLRMKQSFVPSLSQREITTFVVANAKGVFFIVQIDGAGEGRQLTQTYG